jgi:hypothetical protein
MVLRVSWTPKEEDGKRIVREEHVVDFRSQYGGTTPAEVLEGLVDRVYSRFEKRLTGPSSTVPDFTDKYVRATDGEGRVMYELVDPEDAYAPPLQRVVQTPQKRVQLQK